MVDFWLYLSNGQDAPVRFRGVNLNGCRELSESSNYSIFCASTTELACRRWCRRADVVPLPRSGQLKLNL